MYKIFLLMRKATARVYGLFTTNLAFPASALFADDQGSVLPLAHEEENEWFIPGLAGPYPLRYS